MLVHKLAIDVKKRYFGPTQYGIAHTRCRKLDTLVAKDDFDIIYPNIPFEKHIKGMILEDLSKKEY